MTNNLPAKPRRSTPPPSSPVSNNNPAETGEPKPYELISFPRNDRQKILRPDITNIWAIACTELCF
jgi:hypothetical protein